ncbi:MAG TPA: bifunctional 3'-5' exonuclease/DNA polymerase [Pseudonocardiaceae bacterium]|nr:bifunctional 3'-5' exonuclease/DNA polymerase [Pseudonocardiaceae bacterium]
MLVAVVPESGGGGRLRPLSDDGTPTGPIEDAPDLAAKVIELESAQHPRWLWASGADSYPTLFAAGARVDRSHDVSLVEGILLHHVGQHAEPRGLAAALARALDLPVPDDPPLAKQDLQPALFEPEPQALPGDTDPLDALAIVYRTQRERLAAADHPDRVRLLAAADSACVLTAVEMSHHGLPWRTDIHAALLVDLLGPKPAAGARPRKLVELAEQIAVAFGGREVNPDHPPSVVRAFGKVGIDVPSSRRWVLRQIEHPAVQPLLEYKELSRLYVAHGWSWLDAWVHKGRFRPEYVVGGVVSGRWATRGGAALQLPKVLRTAVVANPGWTFVAADAAQLEPRVLAALSEDDRLAEVSTGRDLYAGLASDAFANERGKAKIAMLSAMYGGTSGDAGPLLATLRRRFPKAVGYVEDAARAGEAGQLVRSRLGRTSPHPSAARQALLAGTGDERRSRQAAREWGRFTRNFVVQASAADWTAVLLATLRTGLAAQAPTAELVFFQHDEVLVHCRQADADAVVDEIGAAAETASALVFGPTKVHFPLEAKVVDCYADAK